MSNRATQQEAGHLMGTLQIRVWRVSAVKLPGTLRYWDLPKPVIPSTYHPSSAIHMAPDLLSHGIRVLKEQTFQTAKIIKCKIKEKAPHGSSSLLTSTGHWCFAEKENSTPATFVQQQGDWRQVQRLRAVHSHTVPKLMLSSLTPEMTKDPIPWVSHASGPLPYFLKQVLSLNPELSHLPRPPRTS